jgi:hypothetical protein
MASIVVTLESVKQRLQFPRRLEIDHLTRERPVDGTANNDGKID